MDRDGIYLGKERTKRRRGVRVPEEALSTHVHIVGRSGMGKSWLVRQMVATDAENNDKRNGPGFCLIDPAGDLYDFALDVVSTYPQARKRLHLIDATQKDYFVGLNYLDQPGNLSTAGQIAMIIHGIQKAFGQEEEATRVRMERMFRMVLEPLLCERDTLTFKDIAEFVGVDPTLRNAVLTKLAAEGRVDRSLLVEWRDFNLLRPERQKEMMESVLNRISRFTTGKEVLNVFCQASTIDIRKAMDERHVILCKLPESSGYDTELLDFMGINIVDRIMQAGFSRVDTPEHKRVPFRVYIDEFARFVSNRDIVRGLNEMRKFRVSFVLAHQFLNQLKAKDEQLYHAVKANCNVRILFSVDAEDAEVIAKEMFTNFLAQDQILHKLETQKVTPRETTRVVTSETEIESFLEAASESVGGADSFSTGAHDSAGISLIYAGEEGFIIPDPTSTVRTATTGYTSHSAHANTWVSTTSTARSSGRAVGRIIVPFIEPIVGKQVTSVQFRSYQDKLATLVHRIVIQDRQCAFIQVGRTVPIPFITAEVKWPKTTHAGFRIVERCAYKVNQSGLPATVIEQQLEERAQRIRALIEAHRQAQLPAGARAIEDADFEVVEEKPRRKRRLDVRKQSRKEGNPD